jgi:hypothetical protein
MNQPTPVIAGLAASSLAGLELHAITGGAYALARSVSACGSEASEWIRRSFLQQSGRQ